MKSRKILAFMFVICMMLSMVMVHSYASEQSSNITYVNEDGKEVQFKQVAVGAVLKLLLLDSVHPT